jgi:hypothetical protein
MRWALPVVLLSGCGRWGFDPSAGTDDGNNTTSDVMIPIGHDEDGDGVPDVSDFCPHIASQANADSDGDGVGDICDPQPAMGNQHWIAFSPMIGDDGVIETAGSTWTMGADTWDFTMDTIPQNLIRTDPVKDVDVWVGEDITTTTGAGGRQLAIVIRDMANTPYYYGEVFDAGTSTRLHIEYYDGTNYNALTSDAFAGGFPSNTSLDLHLQASAAANTFTFTAAGQSTSAATAGYAGGAFILIATGNCSGRIRYIAIVGS